MEDLILEILVPDWPENAGDNCNSDTIRKRIPDTRQQLVTFSKILIGQENTGNFIM